MPDAPLSFVVPWPPKECGPNRRDHWSVTARFKKRYREACWAIAYKAGAKAWGDGAQKLNVHLDFLPPNKRARDADNCLASMKAGLDGISDALGIDDKHFRVSYELHEQVAGMVRCTINRRESK